jgi:hypothetical protein
MRAKADVASCEPCHAPLKQMVDPSEPVIDEGVTCEVCHAIASVKEEGSRAHATYVLEDNIKRGPICGSKDIYFHKMGCSPLHQESLVCAGCHHWAMPLPGGGEMKIFTAYEEWKKSSYAATAIGCQDCHMPAVVDDVAAGWNKKVRVANHGFMGDGGDMRRRALALKLSVEDKAGRIHAEIDVKNEAAGHKVPAGVPGRQVVLRVRVRDKGGRVVDEVERVFARVLVDSGGKEVPFYAARREAGDTRIEPGQARTERLSFDAKGEGEIVAELLWRRISPAIAEALGAHLATDELKLAEARVPFGAFKVGSAGRALLPRTVTVKP